jgi:hypothetical protein
MKAVKCLLNLKVEVSIKKYRLNVEQGGSKVVVRIKNQKS